MENEACSKILLGWLALYRTTSLALIFWILLIPQTCAAVDVEEHVWELEEEKILGSGAECADNSVGYSSRGGSLGGIASMSLTSAIGLGFLSSRSSISSTTSDGDGNVGSGVCNGGGNGSSMDVGDDNSTQDVEVSNPPKFMGRHEGNGVATRSGEALKNGVGIRGGRRERGLHVKLARMVMSLGRASTVGPGR